MNLPAPSLLQQLRERAQQLPRAQRQVIQLLLQDPQQALNLSVDELAQRAQVSMPTIMRTARSFGFEGVREFKLALAQDVAVNAHIHRSVTLQDSAGDIVQKIIGGAAASIASLQQQLDVAALQSAARALAGASRIDCYSVGTTSSFMANDLQGRLFRLGRPAHAFNDAHSQLISAATLGPQGVAVAISHVGRMPYLLEAVHFARAQGATVIALTQPDTPLAREADCLLGVTVPQDAVVRVGTEAYLAHLLVIEILMVLVAQQLGPAAAQQLQQFKRVLHEHGLDSEDHPALAWAWSPVEREQLP